VILVTGAAGFLGRFLCAELVRQGVAYIGVDLHAPEDASPNCQVCDLTAPPAIAGLFARHSIDAVIHLAAVLPTAGRSRPLPATNVNIGGSINLIEAATAARVRRFVFGSSMSVYGLVGPAGPLSEDYPACPADLYGAAKRYVEVYGETAAAHHAGFEFLALRMATVVGPGARHTASPWRSQIFEMLSSGTAGRIALPFGAATVLSLVHAGDVARQLTLLASKPNLERAIYNSPAEHWRADKLKQAVESLNANVSLELTAGSAGGQPPIADGSRFAAEFGWHADPLAGRLAKAAEAARIRSL
jgi:nucleoside-diphosphate-sugar epimerase